MRHLASYIFPYTLGVKKGRKGMTKVLCHQVEHIRYSSGASRVHCSVVFPLGRSGGLVI